jgi:addiction module HigA family antidote
MTSLNTAWSPDWVVAPGELLVEALAERGMTQAELARRIARPLKTVSEIATGKAAITPETAIQLEFALGISASFWNGTEVRYREGLARQRSRDELRAHVDWARSFPVSELERSGQLVGTDTPEGLVAAVLSFFSVSSPAGYDNQWGNLAPALRVDRRGIRDDRALAAWLRWGERAADWDDLPRFEPRKLRATLDRVRTLTRSQFLIDAVEQARLELRSAGVALAVVPGLPGASASGAARWVRASRPLIQLSARYKSDDHLWYSLYHEGGHLLTMRRRRDVVENTEAVDLGDRDEASADAFAREALLPSELLDPFTASGDFGRQAVLAFASRVGVAPGIVVGRLQHDSIVGPAQLNDLKRPVDLVQPA